MNPTIYDVSRLSGVSIATISRTFANPELVRESTRIKVLEVARMLHYSPNAIARSMARQRTDKIAFLICKEHATILDEFYAGICEGCMRAMNNSDYQLIISTSDDWGITPSTAQSKQIDGVILAGNASTEMIAEFQGQGISVVLANNRIPGMDFPCVVSDEKEGIRLAIEHLIRIGRKDIAYISGDFSPYIVGERYNAFVNIAAEHGIRVDIRRVKMCPADVNSAMEAAMELLSQNECPNAIIGANDVIAAGVMKAVKRLNKRIPEDVAVIGFDDSIICTMLDPELTSIHINCRRIGELCVERMMSLLKNEEHQIHTVVEAELKIRNSTWEGEPLE